MSDLVSCSSRSLGYISLIHTFEERKGGGGGGGRRGREKKFVTPGQAGILLQREGSNVVPS